MYTVHYSILTWNKVMLLAGVWFYYSTCCLLLLLFFSSERYDLNNCAIGLVQFYISVGTLFCVLVQCSLFVDRLLMFVTTRYDEEASMKTEPQKHRKHTNTNISNCFAPTHFLWVGMKMKELDSLWITVHLHINTTAAPMKVTDQIVARSKLTEIWNQWRHR